MSADSWRVCPRCKAKRDEVENKAAKAYGKVSEQEYKELLRSEEAEVLKEMPEVFREDYEIYMTDDGTFNVSYHGECQECQFKHTFTHRQRVEL